MAQRNIYLASSWRNEKQPEIVATLRKAGHEVYDFRNPLPGDDGFHWSKVDPDWQTWTAPEFIRGLAHQASDAGYALDFNAMKWADTFVLLLPCGKSAHLELGWAAGQGKETYILLDADPEPELMYKMVNHLCADLGDLLRKLDFDSREK